MADVETRTVDFSVNGGSAQGFLARPQGEGSFPAVIVVQEWWGLDDHIKDVAQRLAREGFVALAPDLYHGRVTKEPSEAQKMMMELNMDQAVKELSKAADWLAQQPELQGRGIGAIGFCMGGGLALTLACESPHIKAAAPFYGVNPRPIEKVANLKGPVFAVYGEKDAFAGEGVRKQLEGALKEQGIQHEVKVYAGADHAFFNDTRPEVYDREASADAWQRALRLFNENL